MENENSGVYSILGFTTGILISLATDNNLVFGVMLGVVISIAMEWGDNLYRLYQKNKEENQNDDDG